MIDLTKCRICGKIFDAYTGVRGKRSTVCGDDCRAEAKKQYHRRYYLDILRERRQKGGEE